MNFYPINVNNVNYASPIQQRLIFESLIKNGKVWVNTVSQDNLIIQIKKQKIFG